MDPDCVKRFDPFEVELGGIGTDEVVTVLGKMNKNKSVSYPNEKPIIALKNHRETEKRRRERINGHLATLQGHLTSSEKMDKATLLAEVINQVKDLQEHARLVTKGLLMPMETDELIVEPLFSESQNEVITFKVSLCCDFRPDLFSDIRKAIGSLKLKTHHSEITMLGERVKTFFVLSGRIEQNITDDAESHGNLANAILQALSCVLCKPPLLPEYSLRTT